MHLQLYGFAEKKQASVMRFNTAARRLTIFIRHVQAIGVQCRVPCDNPDIYVCSSAFVARSQVSGVYPLAYKAGCILYRTLFSRRTPHTHTDTKSCMHIDSHAEPHVFAVWETNGANLDKNREKRG